MIHDSVFIRLLGHLAALQEADGIRRAAGEVRTVRGFASTHRQRQHLVIRAAIEPRSRLASRDSFWQNFRKFWQILSKFQKFSTELKIHEVPAIPCNFPKFRQNSTKFGVKNARFAEKSEKFCKIRKIQRKIAK